MRDGHSFVGLSRRHSLFTCATRHLRRGTLPQVLSKDRFHHVTQIDDVKERLRAKFEKRLADFPADFPAGVFSHEEAAQIIAAECGRGRAGSLLLREISEEGAGGVDAETLAIAAMDTMEASGVQHWHTPSIRGSVDVATPRRSGKPLLGGFFGGRASARFACATVALAGSAAELPAAVEKLRVACGGRLDLIVARAPTPNGLEAAVAACVRASPKACVHGATSAVGVLRDGAFDTGSGGSLFGVRDDDGAYFGSCASVDSGGVGDKKKLWYFAARVAMRNALAHADAACKSGGHGKLFSVARSPHPTRHHSDGPARIFFGTLCNMGRGVESPPAIPFWVSYRASSPHPRRRTHRFIAHLEMLFSSHSAGVRRPAYLSYRRAQRRADRRRAQAARAARGDTGLRGVGARGDPRRAARREHLRRLGG